MPKKPRKEYDCGGIKTRLQKLDGKGQIVISKDIRKAADIKYGDYVYIKSLGEGKILITRIGTEIKLEELIEKIALEQTKI